MLALAVLGAGLTACPPPGGPTFATVEEAVAAGVVESSVVSEIRDAGSAEVLVTTNDSALAPQYDEDGNERARTPAEMAERAQVIAGRLESIRVGDDATGEVDLPHLGIKSVTVSSADAILSIVNSEATGRVRARMAPHGGVPYLGPRPNVRQQLVRQPAAFAAGATGSGQVVAVVDGGGHMDLVAPRVSEMAPYATVRRYHARVIPAGDRTLFDGVSVLEQMEAVLRDRSAGVPILAVNMSFSLPEPALCDGDVTGTWGRVVNRLWESGILAIGAAGNDARADGVAAPGCAPRALSVGATYTSADQGAAYILNTEPPTQCEDIDPVSDQIGCFSNSGPALDVLAPSVDGTSAAAPLITGAAAALMSTVPTSCWSHLPAALTTSHVTIRDPRNGVARPRLDLEDARLAIRRLCGLVGDKLAVGENHVCLITPAGRVKCSGYDNGQLGTGTPTNVVRPSDLAESAKGVIGAVDIAAGQNHSCALESDGEVRCWGANHSGQIGTGSTDTPQPTPVPVGVSRTVAIAAGDNHTCIAITTGAVQCCGANQAGQLGNGTTTSSTLPVQAMVPGAVLDVDAAGRETCALTQLLRVYCWGDNVGLGVRPNPERIGELDGSTSLWLGRNGQVCGRPNGTTNVKCTRLRLLGVGLPTSEIPAVAGAIDIADRCALMPGNSMRCWFWNGAYPNNYLDYFNASVTDIRAVNMYRRYGGNEGRVCYLIGDERRLRC